LKFIDLFAGVGGFRLGLEKSNQGLGGDRQAHLRLPGGREALDRPGDDNPQADRPSGRAGDGSRAQNHFECVWSCEVDRWCRAVYRYHWKETPAGDARQVRPDEIPDFDLLCAGFPCQSFSTAGKRGGFADTRGTLYHEICRIARAKRPPLLLLENVQGLLSSNTYRDFAVVLESLGELGYDAEWQVLNSKGFGVPQRRRRVFLVGHLGGIGPQAVFPIGETDGVARREVDGRGLQDEAGAIHARYGAGWRKHAQETYIAEGELMDKIRYLTPRECERLQGFPDDWTRWGIGEDERKIEISDRQRRNMIGNAVTVSVVEFIARRLPT